MLEIEEVLNQVLGLHYGVHTGWDFEVVFDIDENGWFHCKEKDTLKNGATYELHNGRWGKVAYEVIKEH